MKPFLYSMLFAVLLCIVVPFVADIHFYSVLITILCWIMFGQAWNLLGGFTGQISFGHTMFLGIGAYTGMLLVNNAGWDMSVSLLAGGLISALFSLFIGTVIFRLQGPYFGLGTLAIAEILLMVARNWKSVTNGGEGLMLNGNARFLGMTISDKQDYFYIALFLTLAVCLFCHYLMKSKTGYSFIAVRENQEAAEAMGLNTTQYKTIALFLSAFLAGMAGAFYGLYNKFIDPDMTFQVHLSAEMIFITVLGGIGTIMGPIIGSTILITLQEWLKGIEPLQAYPSLYLVIYGFCIMLVIVYLPGGIVGGMKKAKHLVPFRRGKNGPVKG